MEGKYKNKWFRIALERELTAHSPGVNIHCKPEGIQVTVPPITISEYNVLTREEIDLHNVEMVGKYLDRLCEEFDIEVNVVETISSDNVKILYEVKDVK